MVVIETNNDKYAVFLFFQEVLICFTKKIINLARYIHTSYTYEFSKIFCLYLIFCSQY